MQLTSVQAPKLDAACQAWAGTMPWKCFAVACGGAEPDGVSVSIHPMDLKEKGRAGKPDPDFRGIDAVPVGAFACREKEQNGACSPSAAVCEGASRHSSR